MRNATRREYAEMKGKNRWNRLRGAFLPSLFPEDFEDRVRYAEDCAPLATGLAGFENGHDLLGDGSLAGIPLPGHTRSQLGLLLRDGTGRLLLAGDACWKIEGLERRKQPSRVAAHLFADNRAYEETFFKLAELHHADPSLTIIPSHCVTTWQRIGNTRHVTNA